MADRIPHARLTRRQFLAASTLSLAMPTIVTARQATPAASPVPDGPHLIVGATSLRYDEAFEIAVNNLEPGTEVTIRSSFIDGRARTWRAEATWIANEYRYIACSEYPPVRGDFDVADSMAFIWAAKAAGDPYFVPPIYGPNPVTITASIGDEQFDAATIERTVLPQGAYHEDITGEDLIGSYFQPPNGTALPAPAMIVIGGSEGGLSPILQLVAAQLASHGYATLALAWFGVDPLPPSLESVPLEYFGNAIAWLQSQPDVDPERIGMMGFSRGAEATLLATSHYPELKVAISYAGSGVAYPALSPGDPKPSFTWNGEPIPFATSFYQAGLEAAAIPVEQIGGPVILISGDGDWLWPATRLSRVAWDRLQQADRPWPDQFLHYPGAGHGITAPYTPMTFIRDIGGYLLGGNPHDDQVASVNA
jgi:dienelactone hydrolase